MRKRLLFATLLMVFLLSMTAFAGTWVREGTNWKFKKDNGNWAVSEWIKDNGKDYYLGADGIMLHDTTTPDGYKVGSDGAWIEFASTAATNTAVTTRSAATNNTKESGSYVGSVDSNKYHYPSCRWAKEIIKQNEIWFDSKSDAAAHGYVPCKVCKP